jgi:putative ABC transport system permease protein
MDWRSRSQSFASLDAYEEARRVIQVAGTEGASHPSADAERVPGGIVSAGLFANLGIQPALGRGFTADDDRAGAEPVALVSDTLWKRRFGGDPRVLGSTLLVDGTSHTVIGVMPPGFRFPEYAQFWTPLTPARHQQKRSERSLGVIARLKPDVSIARAAAEMRGIGAGVAATHPDTNGAWAVRVRSLHDDMTEETVAPAAVLLGAVGFVLLIACANASNLLLVRAAERSREMSIRVAIGASRVRIVRLVLAESISLGAAGGILGLTVALWANRVIVASFGIEPPYWIRFGVDGRVFAFCFLITLLTSVLFGLAPALVASRRNPHEMLKEGGGTSSGRPGRRAANALIVAQLALALTLLAGAGLLIKTVVRSMRFDPGFNTAGILEGDVSLPAARYRTDASINLFVTSLMEQLARVPNARAGMHSFTFFGGFGARSRQVTIEGHTSIPEGASPRFYFGITPGYFRMMGVRLREGREFGDRDGTDVVVVNEEMASRIWGSQSPLGARIRFGDKPWRTVVGVVSNINGGVIGARQNPLAYVPFASEPGRDLAVMLSTDGDASALAPSLRAAVRAADPNQPVEDVMTMADAFREQTQPSRFIALLMSGLSIVAIALASVGLYAVTAYGVRRRLREIGIRLALGGTARDVLRLILASAWRVIAPGLALGIGAAWLATRALQGVLFGTSPTDPIVFTLVVITLAVVASLASYFPARRAARVDPIVVLRDL